MIAADAELQMLNWPVFPTSRHDVHNDPSLHGDQMGDVVQFPKPDPERDQARLIREARALYESVFPTEKAAAGVQPSPPG